MSAKQAAEVAGMVLGLVNPLLGALMAATEIGNLFAQAQSEGRDLTDEEMSLIRDKRKSAIDKMNSTP